MALLDKIKDGIARVRRAKPADSTQLPDANYYRARMDELREKAHEAAPERRGRRSRHRWHRADARKKAQRRRVQASRRANRGLRKTGGRR